MNNVKNYETIRIHRAAYDRLKLISLHHAAAGSPRSMTALASEAILSIQEPDCPNAPALEELNQEEQNGQDS